MTAEAVASLLGALEQRLGAITLVMLVSDTGGDETWQLLVSAPALDAMEPSEGVNTRRYLGLDHHPARLGRGVPTAREEPMRGARRATGGPPSPERPRRKEHPLCLLSLSAGTSRPWLLPRLSRRQGRR